MFSNLRPLSPDPRRASTGRWSPATAGAALLLFGAFTAWLAVAHWPRLGDRGIDNAGQLLIIRGLAAGKVLYRDIMYPYGPLPVVVTAWLTRVWDDPALLLCQGLVGVPLSAWLWARLGAELLGRTAGLLLGFVVLCCFGTYPLALVPYNVGSFWASVLLAPALLHAVRMLRTGAVSEARRAGLWLGLMGACKPAMGGALFVALLAGWALWRWRRPPGDRDAGTDAPPRVRRAAAAFALGAALPVALVFLPFAFLLSPREFFHALVPTYMFGHYGGWQWLADAGYPNFGGHLLAVAALDGRFASWDTRFLYAPWTWLHLSALAGAVLATPVLLVRRRARAATVVLSASLAASLLFVNILANLISVLALGLLWWGDLLAGGRRRAAGAEPVAARGDDETAGAAPGASRRRRSPLRPAVAALGALAVALVALRGAAHARLVLDRGPDMRWLWRRGPLPDDLARLRTRAGELPTGPHALLCLDDSMPYYVADRLPPVPDYYWAPGYLSAAWEAQLAADLNAGAYALVVTAPGHPYWGRLHPALYEALGRGYRLDERVGAYEVFVPARHARHESAPRPNLPPP